MVLNGSNSQKFWVVDNLLLDHVGLTHVLDQDFITPLENPSGVQKKSAKILTMEVKTNKRTKSSQKWLISDVSCHYLEPL